MADELSILDPTNPAIAQYREQAPDAVKLAEALVIATDADLLMAGEHTKSTTAACKAIKALFAPAKKALTDAKRQVDALEKSLLSGFEKADEILREKVTKYQLIRRQAAEEAARKLAEELRVKREAEQLEAAVQLENLAVKTGQDHYRVVADRLVNQPVATPIVAVEAPKVAGITLREETGVQTVDLPALIAAAAAGKVSSEALLPNEKWLRKQAEARGNTVKHGDELYPGVIVTKTADVTVRTR